MTEGERSAIASEIIEDAHEIALLVAAHRSIASLMAVNPDSDVFLDETNELIRPRLLKRLLSLSGVMRNFIFDGSRGIVSDEHMQYISSRDVGRIQIQSKPEEILHPREACNKVLHYKFVSFDDEMNGIGSKFDVFDSVIMRGTKDEKDWTALINVPAFAAAAYFAAITIQQYR